MRCRAAWKARIDKMRNEGLYTPPGLTETITMPGARGGSNWGSGAVNPAKGLMYLNTQDWPTIYKLSLEDPLAKRVNGTGVKALYEARCQACHGVNGVRAGSGPPALAGLAIRVLATRVQQVARATPVPRMTARRMTAPAEWASSLRESSR